MIRRLTSLLGMITVAIVLGGCMDEPPPLTRVAANQWIGYSPLFAARDAGHLSAPDVRIRTVEMTAATQVMTAMRAGMLEAAALTADEALRLIAEGEQIRIAMVFNFSTGGDVLLTRPGVTSISDLQGRRIGVEPTATGSLFLAAALGRHGLRLDDVKVQPLTPSQHLVEWQNGKLDALVSYEPHLKSLLASGAVVLTDTTADPELVLDVLVVRADVDEKHGAAIRKLIKGYFQAHAEAQRNLDAFAAMVSPRIGLNPEEMTAALRGIRQPGLEENLRLLSGKNPPLRRMLERITNIMMAEGMLVTRPQLESAISAEWLPNGK